MALTDAGYEDVRKAVIVVIADGHAHSVQFDIQARGLGYVRECSIAIVLEELQRGALALVTGPIHGVH